MQLGATPPLESCVLWEAAWSRTSAGLSETCGPASLSVPTFKLWTLPWLKLWDLDVEWEMKLFILAMFLIDSLLFPNPLSKGSVLKIPVAQERCK